MKKLIMFFMVLMLCLGTAGEAEAWPSCLVVCPTDAGDGDEVIMNAYDENGEWFDLSPHVDDWVEICFGGDRDGTPGCVWASGEGDKYLDVSSGSAVFTITQAMLDSDTFTFELYLEQEGEGVAFIMLAFPDAEPDEEPPFDTVAEAVAAGGNCEGLGCLAPITIAIDPNVMLVYETGETEGNFGVSLRYEPPPGATITVTVDPNNGGPSEDFTLLGSTDPNGSIALTFNTGNWDVPQTVVFKAIDDDISDDLPELLEEHTILLVSSYPGHSTDVNFVGENNVTATVVDNDLPLGETLYNGIVLPYTWPPQYPPAVVPIDVGRQFFVDDFLVETTTMTRTFHLPEFHASNPVIQADRTWEAYAIPSSGGAWYDPDDSLFKLWYSCHDGVINDQEGGLGPVSLATSLDGVNWDKPNYGSGKNIVLDVTHDSSVIWGPERRGRGTIQMVRHRVFRHAGRRSNLETLLSHQR